MTSNPDTIGGAKEWQSSACCLSPLCGPLRPSVAHAVAAGGADGASTLETTRDGPGTQCTIPSFVRVLGYSAGVNVSTHVSYRQRCT